MTQAEHVHNYVWHVRDVVAVLEIKKTLYRSDLADAFAHLAEIKSLERRYLAAGADDPSAVRDLTLALRAYGQITGKVAPPIKTLRSLPPGDRITLSTLISERLGAIRIVFGYSGFKSEQNFRNSLFETCVENAGTAGYGVSYFPHLIVSGEYAMVKANGMPYVSLTSRRRRWDFYCSTKAANPLLILLELLWTRLDADFGIGGMWGTDLSNDVMHAFLSANVEERDGKHGWALTYHDWPDKALTAPPRTEAWEPAYLTRVQADIIGVLLSRQTVDFADQRTLDWLVSEDVDPDELRASLMDTQLVAMDRTELKLITEACKLAALPDGRFVAAEDNSGRLTRWIAARWPIIAIVEPVEDS